MNFFCKKNVKPFFAIAGFNAGYMVAKNNPGFVKDALPVIDALLDTLKGGSTEEALNALFKEAVLDLVESNPLVQANLILILNIISFDIKALETPTFSLPELEAMINNFKSGLMAVKL